MADSEPAYLTVGTEVSAKFKGAFCEAKIKKVTKKIRCKVGLKEHPFGTLVVENHQIKGDIYEVNHVVDVIQGKSTVKGIIQQVKDCSSYDVVFNDGDEKTLRRTQLCLKGGRHFDEKVSLDSLPLYNPEQWINNPHLTKSVEIMPKDLVKKLKRRKAEETPSGKRKKREESDDEGAKKREKRAAASAASVAIEEMDQGDTEISGDGSSSAEASDVENEREKDRKKQEMDKREKSVHKSPEEKTEKYTVGDVICYYEDPAVRGKWLPGIVVSRKIYKTTPKPAVLTKKDYPVRLFTNGRYYKATLKQLSLFEDQRLRKKALEAMNANMKVACERAQAFLDKEALPAAWKRNEVFDDEEPSTSKEKEPKEKKDAKSNEKKKEKEKEKKVESESSSEEESEDEASAEERDLFVAQLYKFQEDRGTPINRAPVLGGKDIDLYRFYQVVQNYGGAKRVTANGEWKKVLIKLKLEGCPGATPVTVRKAYGRYLAHFNSFYKSLGSWTQSSSNNGTASPRDRRVLLRGPTEDKKKKKKSTGDKKKDDEKESTVEKESSVESKDEKDKKKEEKKEEKKTTEKTKESKTEKIERSQSISEKDKKEEKEKAKEAAAKVKEEKKEAEKKKEEKPKRKKEDSESTAEPESTSGSRGSRAPSKSESTNDEDDDDDDDYDLPFKGKRPKGYEDDAESTEWLAADIFVHFYLGQKVRAWHHGKWYEARVVNFHQVPRFDMLDHLKKHERVPEPIIPADLVRYLTRHIQDTRVFVHYLGWNSRYDENVSLAKLKCEAKDVETSLAYYHPGCAPGEFVYEPFLKRILAFVRGPQGILSLKREHTKGGGLGMNGYRPRRITREKYEQILAAELSHKPKAEPKRAQTSSPAVSSSTPNASQSAVAKDKAPETAIKKMAVKKEPEETEDEEEEEEDEKEELPGPSEQLSTATPSAESVASPAPSASPAVPVQQPKEEIKEEIKEKTPKEPTPIASPRSKRQRTISTASNRTASPAVITTPPPVVPAPVEARAPVVPSPPKTPQQAPPAPNKSPTPPGEYLLEGFRNSYGRYIGEITQAEKELWRQRMLARVEKRRAAREAAKRPRPPTVLMTTAERKRLKCIGVDDPIPNEEEGEDEDEEEYEEEEEEYDEKEEVKEEPVKLREMPRRATLLVKETARLPEETPKRRRKESELVEETKEEVEDEEDEEFEQLEEEAKNLLNTTRDEESDTGSGSATPHRDEDEMTEEQATPGSSGKTKKAVKRKRMFNSRHSQMVVDKKYMKHKPKANQQHEESDDEEEEESTFNKESYVKRKNNMYKQLEAENKLDDCSSIGMECITKMIFPADQIIPNYEAHLIKLRSIYASARQEIHILERQRRAQEEKKREVRDRERHLKESMSSPSQSSSSTATADST